MGFFLHFRFRFDKSAITSAEKKKRSAHESRRNHHHHHLSPLLPKLGLWTQGGGGGGRGGENFPGPRTAGGGGGGGVWVCVCMALWFTLTTTQRSKTMVGFNGAFSASPFSTPFPISQGILLPLLCLSICSFHKSPMEYLQFPSLPPSPPLPLQNTLGREHAAIVMAKLPPSPPHPHPSTPSQGLLPPPFFFCYCRVMASSWSSKFCLSLSLLVG